MISPKIKGWANFFRHACAKQIFSRLDNKIFKLLWKWAKSRHSIKGKHWIKARYFKSKGKRHCGIFGTDKKRKSELPLFDAAKIIRHTKIKCQSNPYDKDWYEYFNKREMCKLKKPTISKSV